MTYVSGSTILATDFNGFLGPTGAGGTSGANLYDFWGTGSGDKGWGQSTISNPSTASTVTATQWATLVNNLSTAGTQTSTTLTSRTAPTAGTTISILSALNTDLTNVTTNRGNAAAIGSQVTSGGSASGPAKTTNPAGWTITFTETLTFPSADQARYFWNAGGLARLDFSKSSTGTDKDADWNAFAAQVGQIYFAGYVNSASQRIAGTTYTGTTRIGGAGGTQTVLATNVGWYGLTPGGAAATIFTLFDSSSAYTGDYITITAAVNSGATTLTFTIYWHDSGYSGPGQNNAISAGATTALSYYPPSTSYLTNTWGTPTLGASVA
jgi:hypothetical protein